MPHQFHRLAFFAAAFAMHAAAADLTFERDVRPILKTHCFQCHGEGEKLKGGVDLRLRRLMLGKTKDGDPVLTPGKPGESEIVLVLRHSEMPEKGKPLAPEQIALIEQWVSQGAKTARAEPAEVPKYFITEEEREFWAFQPIRRPEVPRVKSQPAPGADAKSEIRNQKSIPLTHFSSRNLKRQDSFSIPRLTRRRCCGA